MATKYKLKKDAFHNVLKNNEVLGVQLLHPENITDAIAEALIAGGYQDCFDLPEKPARALSEPTK